MATYGILEQFELAAPPEQVWRYLIDPERIALCMPGAELEGKESDTTFLGSVVVKLGTVRITYRGKVEFEEIDHETRRIRMRGTGREKTGSGSARMTMSSQVSEGRDGGSSVAVEAQVEVAGKMVRFGRGMIERLSQEIFKEFVACLASRLKKESTAELATGSVSGAAIRTEASTATAESPPELRPVSLILRVLWSRIREGVRRLFGKGPAA